jgi:hypothetical protein
MLSNSKSPSPQPSPGVPGEGVTADALATWLRKQGVTSRKSGALVICNFVAAVASRRRRGPRKYNQTPYMHRRVCDGRSHRDG